MRSFLRKLRAAWRRRRLGRILGDALALHRRGEARSDGLSLVGFSMKLSVSWRARDIHPWDSDLPEERAAPRLRTYFLRFSRDRHARVACSRKRSREQPRDYVWAGRSVRFEAIHIAVDRYAFAAARHQLPPGKSAIRGSRDRHAAVAADSPFSA
jgi:hypothetical protein